MRNCMICDAYQETKHLPLYVIGSEGLELCHDCEMSLLEVIRVMRRTASLARKQVFIEQKSIVHQLPMVGSGITTCCGKTAFELPKNDRMSVDPARVTCKTP